MNTSLSVILCVIYSLSHLSHVISILVLVNEEVGILKLGEKVRRLFKLFIEMFKFAN